MNIFHHESGWNFIQALAFTFIIDSETIATQSVVFYYLKIHVLSFTTQTSVDVKV